MAKTFKDFIMECEMYDHSKENYDLFKECSELALLEKYIEDQKFIKENAAQISAENVCLTESYFTESDDGTTIQLLEEKYNEKAAGIKATIIKGLYKVLNTFANLFGKLSNKWDSITSAGQNVRKKIGSLKLTDDQVSRIKSIVSSAKSKDNSAFKPAKNQPYFNKIKMNYSGEGVDELKNDLAAALSDTVVVADVSVSAGVDKVGAVPVESIKEAAIAIQHGNPSQVDGAIAALKSTWVDVKKNGLKIHVNTKQIEKNAKDLRELADKMKQVTAQKADQAAQNAKDKVQNAAQNAAGKAEPPVNDAINKVGNVAGKAAGAVAAGGVNAIYSMVTAAVGQSSAIYTKLNSYRSNVITGLTNYLNSISNSTVSTAEEA